MKYLNILVLLFLVGFSTITRAEKTFDCSQIVGGEYIIKSCTTTETQLFKYPIKGYDTLPDNVKQKLLKRHIDEAKNSGGSIVFYEEKEKILLDSFPPQELVKVWSVYNDSGLSVGKKESMEPSYLAMFIVIFIVIFIIFLSVLGFRFLIF